MAELKLSIVGQQVGNYEFSRQVSDADAARIVRAFAGIYGPVIENGKPRPRTAQEVVDEIAKGFLGGVLHQTAEWEQQQAAREAAAAVQPIVVTP